MITGPFISKVSQEVNFLNFKNLAELERQISIYLHEVMRLGKYVVGQMIEGYYNSTGTESHQEAFDFVTENPEIDYPRLLERMEEFFQGKYQAVLGPGTDQKYREEAFKSVVERHPGPDIDAQTNV